MKNISTSKSVGIGDSEVIYSSVEKSIKSLDKATQILKLLGILILLLTFFNIGSFAYAQIFYFNWQLAFIFSWFIFFIIALSLYLHEIFRKQGDVLFEEISDELEWRISSEKTQIATQTPEISNRIALRSFVKTTDLPFVQGKFGAIFYLLLNLAVPILMNLVNLRLRDY